MFEKQREFVMAYRVATQRHRQWGQTSVILSIPLFLVSIALYIADSWYQHKPV